MLSKASPYEVRCFRCDVSFPVETRTCMHCGGAITRDHAIEFKIADRWKESSPGYTPEPIEPADDSLFTLPEYGSDEGEASLTEKSTSIGRSIIRGLGGFVWVILLIGFTLVRNCGGD
jgi:ribosomal protein L37E